MFQPCHWPLERKKKFLNYVNKKRTKNKIENTFKTIYVSFSMQVTNTQSCGVTPFLFMHVNMVGKMARQDKLGVGV